MYDYVKLVAPKYLHSHNKQWYLLFLRMHNFDCTKAAIMMAKHFQWKSKLFGIEKVAQEYITLDDQGLDDLDALQNGSHVSLPGRDTAGRPVIIVNMNYATPKTWQNQVHYSTLRVYPLSFVLDPDLDLTPPFHFPLSLFSKERALWYLLMSTAQDDEIAQKRGMVIIVYSVGRKLKQSTYLKDQLSSMPMFFDSVPYKVACNHFCYDSPTLHTVLSWLIRLTPHEKRLRVKSHFGTFAKSRNRSCQSWNLLTWTCPRSRIIFRCLPGTRLLSGGHLECQYALMTFGIAQHLLTVDHEGKLKPDVVESFMERQRSKEDARQKKLDEDQLLIQNDDYVEVANERDGMQCLCFGVECWGSSSKTQILMFLFVLVFPFFCNSVAW